MTKAKLISAVVALTLPITAHFEGLRLRPYLDSVGVPTICYGETKGITLQTAPKTKAECDVMFEARLGYFAEMVAWWTDVEMHPKTHAALTSFTYNVGTGAYRKSTLRKKLNAGDYTGACNELDRWVFAGGQTLAGLVRRREAEKALCLEGVSETELNEPTPPVPELPAAPSVELTPLTFWQRIKGLFS